MNICKALYPLAEVDVELIEGDMSSSDENFFNEGIDALKNGQIEKLGALLVQVRHQFPVLSHLRYKKRERK